MPKREPLIGVQEIVGLLGLALLAAGIVYLFGIGWAMTGTGALLFGLAVWPYLTAPRKGA